MLPAPSSRPSWWPRSSVLSRPSSSNKQQPSTQGSKLSASKKLSTIATAIGLRPKKSATPVQESSSPVLPLHTSDIESPRPTKQAIKPVSVTVGWTDPRALQHEDFVDTYSQSIFSTPDLDPFAVAKYPEGSPDVSESLHFSTFPELESRVRRDTSYTHNRMSCTSSSTLSHQGSGVTSDSSVSSPLLSPIISGPQLSRLTVDTGRILGRELFPSSPVSPQSIQRDWDDRSPIVASPSSATLRDVSKTRSSGFTDAGPSTPSGTGSLASHRKVSSAYTLNGAPGPRVIIRQPSSSSSHPLRPLTSPPASELPPAPEGVRRDDFSLLPAFSERTAHSAASSSSSLSFASSASSRFDPLEAEGHRRYMRRLKDGKKSVRSRPPSPSKDTSRDVQDTPSKPSSSRREFSPTRTLKKAISIQNLPKKSQGSSLPSPSLPAAEDTKPLKKHRSFHHTHIPVPHIPVPPLPASLKQAGSSTLPSGRDAISVPEERKTSVQAAQKSPLSSPVLNPMYVRRRLFSGTSLRRSTSSHTPEPEDDTQSILSLSPTASPLAPHTAIPLLQPSVSNNPELSSFWDEEFPSNPTAGNESRGHVPKHILSAADILKFENMVRDGKNLNGFERSRGNSFTSPATWKQSARTAPSSATSVRSFSPPSATRHSESLGETSGKSPASGRSRTRGISLKGKLGDVTDGRPQTAVPFPGQTRALSFQSLTALHGLPLPPRIRARPSTSSGTSSSTTENPPLLPAGDRSSVVLTPLSPRPVRRSVTCRTLDSPASTPALRPGISRRPSFLDMRDDADQEPPPPEDSFLDMGKASLDTVRSMEEEPPVPS